MKIDDTLAVNADELAEFISPAEAARPIAPHLWLINLTTGNTRVVRSGDIEAVPDGWALLMTGPDPDWVAQWGGDWQRACDKQLNPLLSELYKPTPKEET